MVGVSEKSGLALLRAVHALRGRRELWLFVVVFGVFAVTAGRAHLCFDVWTSNYASWRLATAHTPYIDGVSIPELDNNTIKWVWIQDAPNGHTVVTRAPAAVLAGLPAYLISQPDHMTVIPAALTAAALTATAVVLFHRAVRTVLVPWQALAAAAAFAFTTPVWSVSANGIWPQTITVLGIAIVAWAVTVDRWWSVGLAGILLLWARPHAAVIVAVVGLAAAWRARSIGIALRAGLPGLLSLPLLCLWTQWIYGSWSPMPLFGSGAFSQVQQSLVDPVNQAAMWVAPDRGLFVFTPVLLVLLPTVVRTWRQLPRWSTDLLVAGLVYTLVQAAIIGYSGGYPIYGYRYGLEFLACAAPAYAFAAARSVGWARRSLPAVLSLQFTVILLGAVVDRVTLWDTDGWTDNAFVHALVHGGPAAPVMAAAVWGTSFLLVRMWTRAQLAAPAPAEPSLGAELSPARSEG
jgi:alpha-1,2-mannosyltransferase